jgi:hypothetical protein
MDRLLWPKRLASEPVAFNAGLNQQERKANYKSESVFNNLGNCRICPQGSGKIQLDRIW